MMKEQVNRYKNQLFSLKPYLPAFLFFGGFLFDVLTLGKIDELSNILTIATYLFLSGVFLFIELNDKAQQKARSYSTIEKILVYKIEIFHFFQGALLSAFTIFYFKSASGLSAFLFILFLSFILVLNEFEFFQKQGVVIKSILFQLSLFSFTFAYFPLVLGEVGVFVFLSSAFINLLLLFLINISLEKLGVDSEALKKSFTRPGVFLLCFFLIMYLLRVIPPLPLGLQKIGIYHDIKKEQGQYHLFHQRPWWKFWQTGDQSFEYRPGDRVFVFTSVFAPRGFNDKLNIHWEYKQNGSWTQTDKIPLQIKGGRSSGFRGFAFKKNIQEGQWRVFVKTSDGLEIGRIDLDINKSANEKEREWQLEEG